MCGIFYYNLTSTSSSATFEEIQIYFEKLSHRGPNNSSNQLIAQNEQLLYIGTHRLSIINLTDNGNQPFELNGVYLCCNGQIYNYLELASHYNISSTKLRSDVDIILYMYEYYVNNNLSMSNMICELNGDFAFFLYDTNMNQLLIARDIYGVRPLYYTKNNETNEIVCISSELKGIPSSCLTTTTTYTTDRFLPSNLLI
jgi:asparagine synthase (glutamine-hydrolysing)